MCTFWIFDNQYLLLLKAMIAKIVENIMGLEVIDISDIFNLWQVSFQLHTMKSVMHFPSTAFLHTKNYLSIDWPYITIIKLSLTYQSVSLSTYLVLQLLVMSYSLHFHGLQHARLPCPSLPWSLLKLMCFESIMPSNHLILYHPLLLLSSVFPSIRVFSNVSTLHIRWPKYWSFRLSISPFNEYSGLISSRIDWFDLLTVQGTL